jgi:TolB-like protein/Tfp pilus assembly protein PilF
MSLFNELKRRNVFRVALAYIVAIWLLLQVADVVLDNIASPPWVFQVIMLLGALGLPIAIIFAWAFELTPEGIKKEKDVDRSQSVTQTTGRKLDYTIIAVLIVAVGYFAIDKFAVTPTDEMVVSNEGSAEKTGESSLQDITSTPVLSIAVLPFVNMSSDPEQEFFSDGISEELLNVLAQFPGLRVAARTSSFQFKGQNQDIGEIAATLNVAHVLEGSVRKSGTKLRITAQLIKADDGFHLWSETYDRELDDVFVIQDEIAKAIGAALKVKLKLDGDGTTLAQPTIVAAANTQAYEAFLRGRQLIHKRGRESLEDAVRYLERSLRLDADYAPAHAQLAIATLLLMDSVATYGTLSLAEASRRSLPHIERALVLAPNLPSAQGAMGLYAMNGSDTSMMIEYTSRAVELNPSYIDAMNWLQIGYSRLGHYSQAAEMIRHIVEIDPLSTIGRINLGNVLLFEKDVDAARANAEQLLQQNLWAGYMNHARIALSDGHLSDGLSLCLKAYSEDPGDPLSNWLLMTSLAYIGEFAEARRVSDTFLFMVDRYAGRPDVATSAVQRRLELDPDNFDMLYDAADMAYSNRQFSEAKTLLDELRTRRPQGRPVGDDIEMTIAYAVTLRDQGNRIEAEANMEISRDDLELLVEAGWANFGRYRAEAMLAAYDGDSAAAAAALREAINQGLRDPMFITRPIFDEVQGDDRIQELQQEIMEYLKAESRKTKQMMCFENPVPEAWQPLAETCRDVVRDPV